MFKATVLPYGYLFLDLHAACNPLLKLRTNILADDSEQTIFTPK